MKLNRWSEYVYSEIVVVRIKCRGTTMDHHVELLGGGVA